MGEDPLLQFELAEREKHKRFREWLAAQGKPELLADYDKNIREINLGTSAARGIWHALSKAQRGVLEVLALDRGFYPRFRESTAENLIRRRLVTSEQGVLKITEHGRFVVKHGPVKTP